MNRRFIYFSFFLLFFHSASASKARELALQFSGRGAAPLWSSRSISSKSEKSTSFELVFQEKKPLPLQRLKVPLGFEIKVFAVVPFARTLTVGEDGYVYVGSRDDKVYRILNTPGAEKTERVEVLLRGLQEPNGVAFHQGRLFVAEKNRLLVVENPAAKLPNEVKVRTVAPEFPEESRKSWKFIRFGAGDWAYLNLPVDGEARIHKFNVSDGSGAFIGKGTVGWGFDWDSRARKLWVPSLHLNPPSYIHPLGVRFYEGQAFPSHLRHQIFMAEQGSWKGHEPRGYRVSVVQFENGAVQKYQPFIEGWLDQGEVWGQPIDLAVNDDGALLISDDQNGVVYRLSYIWK